jgi:hypothetical protein
VSRHQSIGRKSGRISRHNGQTAGADYSNGLTAPLIGRPPATTIPIERSGRRFSPTRFWLTAAAASSVPTAAHVRRAAKPKTLYVPTVLEIVL